MESGVVQFRFFDKGTNHIFVEFQTLINQVIAEKLDEFKFALSSLQASNTSCLLNRKKCLALIFSQLEKIVLSICNILKSVKCLPSAELNLKLMINFYDFLAYFLQLVRYLLKIIKNRFSNRMFVFNKQQKKNI